MSERRVDEQLLREIFAGGADHPGLFRQALGFGSATTVYKEVHLMNDLAQTVLGGAPAHRGDHLCRLIREDKSDVEPTSDASMRADLGLTGEVYRRAFPTELGIGRISALRGAAERVLNFDSGMYRAGDSQASGLATNVGLLGAEGFRRFAIGKYVAAVLGEDGRERLRKLYRSDRDPVTRFLRPVVVETHLVERESAAAWEAPPCPFDLALGRRLNVLLAHPLSKPQLLRYLAISISLGLTLRLLGAGREGGRPIALALAQRHEGGVRPLRQEAVQTYTRGLDALHQRLATLLLDHPRRVELWREPRAGVPALLVPWAEDLGASASAIVAAARDHNFQKELYWPEEFVLALGRRSGCILPRTNRAGWGRYVSLTPDHVEALVLMFSPPGARARPWREVWAAAHEELGLLIGANEYHDAQALRGAGVVHVNMEELVKNCELVLGLAVERGVARRLPDRGAEAGSELQ
jgi:hypothetical protein